MTLTDDLDLRAFVARADDLVPPMALDADVVLRIARRRRRRVAAARGATAALAVGGLAVATLQVGAGPVATAAALPLDATLTAQVAGEVVTVTEDGVVGVDTGVLVPGTAPTDLRYTLVAPDEHHVELRVAAEGSLGTELEGAEVPTRPWSASEPSHLREVGERHVLALGVVPVEDDGASVELVVGGDAYPVPTFEVPGMPGAAWLVRLDDPVREVEQWPSARVVMHLPDGRTATLELDDRLRAAVRLHDEAVAVTGGETFELEVVVPDDAPATD